MREYLFTSRQFTGYMKFGYDQEGVLVKFENNAVLSDLQLRFLSNNFPFAQSDLPKIVNKGKIEECTDLTFEHFWNEYGHKKDKIMAEKYWRKMTDAEKAIAIAGIKRYRYDCKMHNREMVYAIRYLRNKRYMDE
jgi:hypothetical protein